MAPNTHGPTSHSCQGRTQVRLRVHHIDTHHGLLGSEKVFPLQSSCKIRHPLPSAAGAKDVTEVRQIWLSTLPTQGDTR